MEKKFKLQMMRMPNFITIDVPFGKDNEGFKEKPSIPIEQLSYEEAKEYAESMRDAFLAHWADKSPGHANSYQMP